AVRQRAPRIITERQRNQDHANLTDPHVKRAAEILGQISRADDFEHHHRETAQENQAGGGQFAHDLKIAVDAVRREGKRVAAQFAPALKAGVHRAGGLIEFEPTTMSNEQPANDPPASSPHPALTRRGFIRQAGRFATGAALAAGRDTLFVPLAFGAEKKRLKIAAVLTEFTYRSHAHVLLENFLQPYLFNGKLTTSGMDVVIFYVDQFPDRDMAREVAAKYNIKIYRTIAGALCLGGEKLAVDGVLSIGEHGKY